MIAAAYSRSVIASADRIYSSHSLMDVKAPQPAPLQAPTRKGVICKMAGAVSRNNRLCLGIIVVLAILVIGMYVYYHGLFRFGPYCKRALSGARQRKPREERIAQRPPAESGDRDAGDDETEQLIKSINKD
jgi:hypothetical protein